MYFYYGLWKQVATLDLMTSKLQDTCIHFRRKKVLQLFDIFLLPLDFGCRLGKAGKAGFG